jgi:RNA polymerase sigma factor (sigma-70 family)
VSERVDGAHLAARLAGALAELSEGDRDVLALTSWAGLDSGEVAEALGIPVGTVRSRLHRVRKWLRTNAPGHVPGERTAMSDDVHEIWSEPSWTGP